ncbi:hypothetical protein I601_3207 [Nocardioides dokdonensis FR1436]|uniref:Isoprenylcysteine carboxyl methyltransferase (ICMT) family protein n=1 Tax=Nocardioides dokdonensis FR1436 TaxID=1300347 RepID=A0A1A9GMV6_9ACTN|nr:isoprenylcysteine carboxylmethyltransferase family protein [Nocardioides dokdonensis]ANH39614.1 hypothetical protein I601_3207 [Nocardioides dokdonensis FR1436]
MAVSTMIPPPAYAAAAAGAQLLLTRGRRPTRVSGLCGLVLAAGSFGVSMTADRLFRRYGTTDQPFHPERASVLVTDGPFAHTRNPMYVGLTGILLGHAAARRSATALLPIVGFLAAVDRLQIPAEERNLGAIFGAEYDAYRARVPRWLGPVHPGS